VGRRCGETRKNVSGAACFRRRGRRARATIRETHRRVELDERGRALADDGIKGLGREREHVVGLHLAAAAAGEHGSRERC
jgi:hypothetical protein